MKTRTAKKPTAKDKIQDEEPIASKRLPPSSTHPPLMFLLPEKRSQESSILSLPHPATNAPCRFFFDPQDGLYEFTQVNAPRKTPRSWLLDPEQDTEEGSRTRYCIEQPCLFVATPFDPLFVALPALAGSRHFLSMDDHLDTLTASSRTTRAILRQQQFRKTVEGRAAVVCDTVDAGEETMYRLSIERLARTVLDKARAAISQGLPPSMEQKYVLDALQSPVQLIPSTLTSDSSGSFTTDASQASTDASVQTQETNLTEPDSMPVTESKSGPAPALQDLQRLRTAVDFITKSYLPKPLAEQVRSHFETSDIVDWTPLNDHLIHIASLRKEAQALRSLSDNISRKRSHVDEEAEEMRAEKRRKKEEEEAKKKNQSRGVKQLAKVNTSGMKKMSSFFTKKTA